MATQVTITKKQENKGARAIISMTSHLKQVLKQFGGIYKSVLPECDNLTVEGWMEAHGVYRPISKRGTKCDYNPASIMAGWHEGLKECSDDGKVVCSKVFRNVPAKVVIGDINDPEGRAYRVFTKEEAEKLDGKPISVYKPVEIPKDKWSVATILKGLKQSRDFEKENEKSVLSLSEWENLEHVYVVRYDVVKNATGGTETLRKVVEVQKTLVTF